MLSQSVQSRRLAMGVAALAGFVDALGFLRLGGVFVSFMSGNSTRFAVGVSQGIPTRIALVPLGIIGVFVLGVMLGRVVRHFARRRPSTMVLVFVTGLLLVSALLYDLGGILISVPLALAMGAANNIFFREGEVSVGVTYMTGTLVKFGQRLAANLLGEKERAWLPYMLLWAGLVAGALLGSVGFAHFGFNVLWLGVAAAIAITMAFARYERFE